MVFTIRARQSQTFRIPAGSAENPSLTFSNATTSGVFHSGGQGNVGVSVNGIERLTVSSGGATVNGNVIATAFIGDGSMLTNLTVPYYTLQVANVQVSNSTWVPMDDTAVSNVDGGYIILNGNGFWGGTLVTVDSVPALSTSVLSYTQLGAQVQPKPNGTYPVSIIRPDSQSVTLPLGITYSPVPIWSTGSTLANVIKTAAFTQNLAASDPFGSTVSYVTTSGSALPPNVSLSNTGVLSGNITSDFGNSTLYSFSIDAIDAELQNIPRTFSLFANASPTSQALFTTTGLSTWTAPENVYTVCAVCIGGGSGASTTISGGGGGLGWKNNILVTPGQVYTLSVGSGGAAGGVSGNTSYFISQATVAGLGGSLNITGGGGYVGDGGGYGGKGRFIAPGYNGGGGAGGYTGNGGNGGSGTAAGVTSAGGDGQGGGGGGGAGYTSRRGGGGVGAFGQGASGAGGISTTNTGSAGGGSGGVASTGIAGALYGGGAGYSAVGAAGAVRLMWGYGRAYPSTNTANVI